MPYQLAADAVLVLHFAVVLFVVVGLLCVFIGNRIFYWSWVNTIGFRIAHLASIIVVAAQAWLGQECPFTTLESWLRVQGGSSGYQTTFIEYWVHWLIFYQAPSWVFVTIYTAFAALVIASWLLYPPGKRTNDKSAA